MPSLPNTVRLAAPLRRISLDRAEIDAAAERDEREAMRKAAYQQGFEDASSFHNQQLVEQREDVIRLQEETFNAISEQHAAQLDELRALLPDLVMEMTRRVLSGLEPDRGRIERTVAEVLAEMVPGARDVEIALHPADKELLGQFDPQFEEKYPGLRFIGDPNLKVGDCMMRSRYGIVDGRLETKLDNLSRSLQ
jgi:flagellar biosynthesis/type III secretory pathway protein FliH